MRALAFHDGLATPAWQGWTLFAIWLLLFALPSAAVARHARQRGVPWAPWFWLVLFTSGLGVFQYYMDKRISERRAAEGRDPHN